MESVVAKSMIALTAMAAVFGAILAIASRIFAVHRDPRVEEIVEALPGANCGACGFPGCQGYAEAAVAAGVAPAACPPGGAEVAEKVAEYEALLPETLDLDLFLEELGNLAQRNQVHIEKLTPHKVKEHSLFRELVIDVRATGTYLAIYEFMHQLEHGKQLARARELRIASGTPGGKCAADIKLVLYFAPHGKE